MNLMCYQLFLELLREVQRLRKVLRRLSKRNQMDNADDDEYELMQKQMKS